MQLDWTAEVAARMHMAGVTGLALAKEAGITNSYLSAVLHKKKGTAETRQRIKCSSALTRPLSSSTAPCRKSVQVTGSSRL